MVEHSETNGVTDFKVPAYTSAFRFDIRNQDLTEYETMMLTTPPRCSFDDHEHCACGLYVKFVLICVYSVMLI
jgi:hypothetical protein